MPEDIISPISEIKVKHTFGKLADALVEHYKAEPGSDANRLGKIQEEATAWNIGVREDQKVTPEEIEKAKKKLGLT